MSANLSGEKKLVGRGSLWGLLFLWILVGSSVSIVCAQDRQEEIRISLAISKQPIESLISMLAKAGNRTILMGKDVNIQQVSAFFTDVPFSKALQDFASAQELCVVEIDGTLLLISRKEYMASYATTQIVPLKRADPNAVMQIIPISDTLKISVDGRNRSLVLRGDPRQIEVAQTIAENLDSSLTSEVFSIKYASVTNVAEAIGQSLNTTAALAGPGQPNVSPNRIGSIVVDARTNRIIIHETPENLDICREIIRCFDIEVDTRVFSTGKLDPQTVADQIRKGELSTEGAGDAKGKPRKNETNVQVVEGTNQIIVTDTPERLNILERVMSELNRNISTAIVRPNHAAPEEMAGILKGSFPDLLLSVDKRTNSLVVTAHKDRLAQMQEVVAQLDAAANVEVDIEAKIMLVSTGKIKELGTQIYGQNLGGPDETLAGITFNPNVIADDVKDTGSSMGNPIGGPITNPVKSSQNFLEALQPNVQVNALVRALESDTGTTVLSSPRMRTMVGKTASIFSGSKEPYKEVSLQDTRSQENVKFEEIGVLFEITPLINPNDVLTLNVVTDFSTLREVREGVPVVEKRNAQTTVEAKDGETIFLGGLISREEGKSRSGIPALRSIPLLGFAFGAKRARTVEKELVIVIIPRIVRRTQIVDNLNEALGNDYTGIQREFGNTTEGTVDRQ